MRIRYIGHASVTIEAAARRIVCDPWWNGPAFAGRWFQYPLPRPEVADSEKADFIFVSHGHEDHLHVPTLRTMRKEAVALVPQLADTSLRDVFATLGFTRVVELRHGEKRRLAPALDVTLYRVHDDSILVVEADGRTLVNVNDALNMAPRHVIDHVCGLIRARHPHLDIALVGYGAPDWLPACIRLEDGVKADMTAREQAAAEGFAYVAQRLHAATTLPIGGSQVFVDDDAQWINAARLRAPSPCDELRRQAGPEVQTHWLAPGDRVVGDQIRPMGGRRPTEDEVDVLVRSVFSMAISEHRQTVDASEPRLERLLEALHQNASSRARHVLAAGDTLSVRIDVRDVPGTSFWVQATPREARAVRCDRLRLAPQVLEAPLAILEALATQDYGDECITQGCGATLRLREVDLQHAPALIALLGRRPLPPRRRDRCVAWLRAPRRMWQAWRAAAHWRELAARLRAGETWAAPAPEGLDPALWTERPEAGAAPEVSRF